MNEVIDCPRIFYEEPEGDRWILFDKYPRSVLRRILRGKLTPGGMMRYFLNLCAGLGQLDVRYRVNNYRYARHHAEELVCVIGKHHVLDLAEWKNPILFGPAVLSNPAADPHLWERKPVVKVLVSCDWFKRLYNTVWPKGVDVWAAGIDTHRWQSSENADKIFSFLIYDKVRWHRKVYEVELIRPVTAELQQKNLTWDYIRYGSYREEDYQTKLQKWLLR